MGMKIRGFPVGGSLKSGMITGQPRKIKWSKEGSFITKLPLNIFQLSL